LIFQISVVAGYLFSQLL